MRTYGTYIEYSLRTKRNNSIYVSGSKTCAGLRSDPDVLGGIN